ncbi:cellulose synthase protein C [Bordetella ansorpii]|uniref:Cellulose synthase protein C n=1 Tax=Bordetella ansorpii TaxID=288768 RepID=A0A157KAF1_9BORD|nr:cellulose biosynthesis protein BcsC [Bordetella ansorpii]SAH81464.1 cellulose synthase protein C [Bordetella ansorpii]
MSARRYTVVLGLLAAALANPATAWAQDDASRTLVEQGRYWRAQGKPDQAVQAWQKLLLIDPRQPEALYGMAAIAIDRKQLTQARDYLTRLRAAAPASRFVPQLEQDLNLASDPGRGALEKARLMAQDAANKNDIPGMGAAIAQYDQALGGKMPQGDVGREYYNYLGYTDGGLERAIQGLRRLDSQQPGNPAIQLQLAQHMARNERTRAEGIRRLQQLSTRSDIGGAAAEFWRASLSWLGAPRPEDKPLFEAYLATHPDDADIRAQMQQARPAAPAQLARGASDSVPVAMALDPVLARGYAALRRGDMVDAEREFTAKLQTSPNNADALGGLGVVRMRQNNLLEAERLLTRAVSRPGGASWGKSLNSARYWNLYNQGTAALAANDAASARGLFAQATRLDPREPAGRNGLARAYAAQGDLASAEKTYRAVLTSDKRNSEALGGLVGVLGQTGRSEQAMQLVNGMSASQRADLGDLPQLRASVAAGRAKAAEQRGDSEGARLALEDALRDDPNNPWIRLDLARQYLEKGQRTEARGIVDGLLASNPDMPDALYASALLSMQMGESAKAQETLARIPESRRTPAMTATEMQVGVQMQALRAAEVGRAGHTDEARAMLARLESSAGRNPALIGTIAQAYVDAGDTARGMSLMRQLQNGPGGSRPDTLLPYAGLLLKAEQDVEAASVLRQIQAQPLTPDQARQQEDLVMLYTVRQAELLRQRGQLANAYDTLSPVLNKRPDDPLAVGTLARMYADSGDNAKALNLYKQLVEREPNNANLLLGAAQVAAQGQDSRYADETLERAVAAAPDDPDILAGAARVYRMRGKGGKAVDLLAQAIKVKEARGQTQLAMADTQPAAYDNPFAGRSSQYSVPYEGMQDAYPVPASGRSQPTVELLAVPSSKPYGDVAPSAPLAPQRNTPSAIVQPVVATREPSGPSAKRAVAAGTAGPGSQDLLVGRPGSASQSITVPRTVATAPARSTQSAESPSDLRAMQNELQDLRAERSPQILAGAFAQSNNGQPGTSKLTMTQQPVEARLPLGEGKLSLRATPVQLNARSVRDDMVSRSQFGGGPVAALAQQSGATGGPGSQKDSGVGLSVGYETRNLKADIGTTPLGFLKSNVVGGVELKGSIDPKAGTWYSVGASRRAVTDSLASFAGARDARTGDTWGGVTATGVQGQIGIDRPTHGVYGYGSWQSLNGRNVASNTRSEIGGGSYVYLHRGKDSLLTAGVNVGGTFYNNNQRFSTYGNGGYFSPQEFYSLSLPVTWAQRSDRFSYKVQGSVGVQHFRESNAKYFPTSSERQRVAALSAGAAGLNDGAVYPGQSKTGVGYNLAATGEYQLSKNLHLGATVSMDNASDYRQVAGGLYLRYSFYPQKQSMELPVVPYRSPYSR